MSFTRHVDPNHPLKGRMAHLPSVLTPSMPPEAPNQPTGENTRLAASSPPVPAGSKRKRPRAARACEFCREKKYRCDELDPCSRCRKWQQPCIYKNADLARERYHATQHNETFPNGADTENSGHNDEAEEVSEINPHTLNTEFHGPTSSLAFLAAVQQQATQSNQQSQSLVSVFHNESFSPQAARPRTVEEHLPISNRFHFRESRFFLDGYFQNLHFIHPIIDRTNFYTRCEDLWFGRSEDQPASFVALYYAVMSLGAIIQEWDEENIDGIGRFDWARKMFHLASEALESMLGQSDLQTVQACIMMAKVCQNELNPHLAYLYLGRAVRMALAAGFNRRSRRGISDGQLDHAKTWWGLYSLEIEMSFALGRPDSLGLDIYHNQILPPVDDTEHAILAVMVDFGRIIRRVSVSIYASAHSIAERLTRATEIEAGMDAWVESLPLIIRPNFHEEQASSMTKETKWAKKQKHTLKFRYFNVKMVLYRPFLLHAATTEGVLETGVWSAVRSCVTNARTTIRIMHQMYCDISYFRTWWYNVTYTLYASSILLCYLSKLAENEEKTDLLKHVQLSIDVLNAMKDHVVAHKAAAVLRQAVEQLRHKENAPAQSNVQPAETPLMQLAHVSAGAAGEYAADEAYFDPFRDVNLDFMGQLFPFDDNYLSPWPS